jgi:hypothetical protein
MGSTGWLKSLLTGAAAITSTARGGPASRQRRGRSDPPLTPAFYDNVIGGIAWDSDLLFFTVREPFPTRTTGASLVFGQVTPETPLTLESQMAENGVIFSDGIERDFLEFNSGTQAEVGLAERKGVLVV